MSHIEEMLAHNREFVANGCYKAFSTSKFPDKKIAILSCMDTRLTGLLPAALNLKNGDAKIIQNAGALISHPFGSVMRSFIVAIYELGVDTILVVGHYDCGMQATNPQRLIQRMRQRGVSQADLDQINYFKIDLQAWLKGFEDPFESVQETVRVIKDHPLIPQDIPVYGYLMDPETGRLDPVASIEGDNPCLENAPD